MKKLLLTIAAILFCLVPQLHAKDTIKFASIFAKTGPVGSSNLHHLQAVRFAIDEINKSGGLLGKKVELIEYDNQGTPIQSKLAAMKASKTDVCGVIGASWSDHSLAIAPVLQKAKIPMISPDSTNYRLTQLGDYIFRACFIDPFQGKALAKFATENLKKTTAIVLEDVSSSYSQGLTKAFIKNFESLGGKILDKFTYDKTQTDFADILTKTKMKNAEILFIPGHDESGLIVRQAQDIGITATMIGGDGWGYRAFISNGGKDLKKGYYTTHWSKDVDSTESREFVAKYQKVYEINDFAAISYDATMLMADALRRANSSDRATIRNALADTKNFIGVTGAISYQGSGDPVKPAVVLKIENGKASYFDTIYP